MSKAQPKHRALIGYTERCWQWIDPDQHRRRDRRKAIIRGHAIWIGFVLLAALALEIAAPGFGILQMGMLAIGLIAASLLISWVFIGGRARESWSVVLPKTCQALAEHLGWTWTPNFGDSADEAKTTGRFVGVVDGLAFDLDTDKVRRELRIPIPIPNLEQLGSARDFGDLDKAERLQAKWLDASTYPTLKTTLKKRGAQALGRDRGFAIDGKTLVIASTPYKDKAQSVEVLIRRRMREAESVFYLIEAVQSDFETLGEHHALTHSS